MGKKGRSVAELKAMFLGEDGMIDVTPKPQSVVTRQQMRRAFMLRIKKAAPRFTPWQDHRRTVEARLAVGRASP